MTRIGWFHCLAGASGDMMLGALVDSGVPLAVIQEAVDALGVERVEITASEVTRHGLGATKVDVRVTRSTVIRTWPHVRQLLDAAPLALPVRARALAVFERLALAEARIHRTSPDLVHFHEIGGLDAFADIVGTAAGLHHLGLDEVVASPVATGMGMTRGEHGLIPVPTPAVLELLRGAPVYSGGVPFELCTPTGAALLAGTVTRWGDLPEVVVATVGAGAGDRDLEQVPNVLRLVVGDAVERSNAGDVGVVLEANVDDLDPRLWPGVVATLLDTGASDAWLTPIQMKKGRPAVTVSVLAPPARVEALRRVLFRETSTIGLREREVTKRSLDRGVETVTLADGSPVRVKVARLDGEVVNTVPEFEDVATIAAKREQPVKAVLAEAAAAAAALAGGDADA
ncbi:MAG TPA: nickel pincer cofactor biosynthesis protein LarC [Mycobacteriales bacterium]|nr:nickel pincer cofactor biosynthesis protein LarC [Mycobacteriales bacterium]